MRWTDDLDEQEKREKCSQDGGLQSDVKMPNLNALNMKAVWGCLGHTSNLPIMFGVACHVFGECQTWECVPPWGQTFARQAIVHLGHDGLPNFPTNHRLPSVEFEALKKIMCPRWGRLIWEVDAMLPPGSILYVSFFFPSVTFLQLICL